MSVEELHGERTVEQSLTGITARRVFLTTWGDRYSSELPIMNQSHPDASVNSALDKCKVVKKTLNEFGGTDGAGPTHSKVTVEYSTRPTGNAAITAITISFADTNPDTILDSGSGFEDAGFKEDGVITVSGSASNDGTYTIASGGVAAGALTLVGGDSLTPEAAGELVTIVQLNVTVEDQLEIGGFAVTLENFGERKFSNNDVVPDDKDILIPRAVYTKTKILDELPFSLIKILVGQINNDTFLGEAAGKWLFLGASARAEKDSSGDNVWFVDYKFQYQSVGWNFFWNPKTSSFLEITTNPVYTTGDFSTLDLE